MCASWSYLLFINGVEISATWKKELGEVDRPPTWIPPPAPPIHAPPIEPAAAVSPEVQLENVRFPTQSLPQGVSLNAASGLYQANIRAMSGKFVFLGEFSTAEEAHQRYIEAVSLHCPDKLLAPSVPQ